MNNQERREYAQYLLETAQAKLKEVLAKKKGCGEAKEDLRLAVRYLVGSMRKLGYTV